MRIIEKPGAGEYIPDVLQYIRLVPEDGLVLEHLLKNFEIAKGLLQSLPEEKLLYRYANGKWTIKEIVQHISDDERIYAYRALRFARNDTTELPGFDQDDFTQYSDANSRNINDLLDELYTVRLGTISLFKGLNDESLLRIGTANENKMSVRAIVYHIAGHEQWHINIIRRHYL
jgi:uncharacterized damage-inducible protein DinB